MYQDVCLSTETDATRLIRMLKGTSQSAVGSVNIDRVGMEPVAPCVDSWTTIYFNRADVQVAIHAKVGIEWSICSSVVQYSRKVSPLSLFALKVATFLMSSHMYAFFSSSVSSP